MNTGQIYVHDIRKSVLMQAKQRFKRAGIQNYQIQDDKQTLRKVLKKKCDWVLLDVPCTGTGVIRKNPDLKWKYTNERLEELLKIQELILEDSISYLRNKNSTIVYSTCSILNDENLLQVMKFCNKHGFEVKDHSHFSTVPISRGMDGFFSATLVRK